MDKFVDFIDYLKREQRDEFYIDLAEIERIIGQPLASSAYIHSAYWSHDKVHRFAGLIYDAGFKVSPDLRNKRIRLIRLGSEASEKKHRVVPQKLEVKPAFSSEDSKLITNLKRDDSNKEFTTEMVQKVLDALAKKDRFFVSEAHLQTEFIIEAAKLYPDNFYYPELVPSEVPEEFLSLYGEKGIHFDLIIKTKHDTVLVEFKYLTALYSETVNGFDIRVKSHMAMDIRRYDCWKDISRIELFTKNTKVDYGYFVLITNVPGFWKAPTRESYDLELRLNEGLHRRGPKKWKEGASEGTVKGRENPIYINNDYYFVYKDFYDSKEKNGLFKSLIVPINK